MTDPAGRRPHLPVVRAAVVGCGAIGSLYDDDGVPGDDPLSHAGAMVALGNVDLVGGCDVDRRRRRRFEERWGRPAYASHQELLAAGPVDLVSICTPPDSHLAIARDLAAAGVAAVLCEKPIATTVAEGLEVVAACRRARATLGVNHLRRWDPTYQRAAQTVRSGDLGEVQHVSVLFTRGVLNSGVHAVDLVRLFAGEVARVSARDRLGELGHEVDPGLDARLTLASGAEASLVACRRGAYDVFELDVVCAGGRVLFDELGYRVRWWAPGRHRRWVGVPVLVEGREAPALHGVMTHAVGAMAAATAGGPVACTGDDGVAALAVVQAMLASAAEGGSVVELAGDTAA